MNILKRIFIIIFSFFRRKKLSQLNLLTVGVIDGLYQMLVYDYNSGELVITPSIDGVYFNTKKSTRISVFDQKKHRENILNCCSFSLWQEGDKYFLSYITSKNNKKYIIISESSNMRRFYGIRRHKICGDAVSVIHSQADSDKFNFFVEEKSNISVYKTKTNRSIELIDSDILSIRKNYFDEHNLHIIGINKVPEGILLFYDSDYKKDGINTISIGAALLASNNASYVIWRTDDPNFVKEISEDDFGNIDSIGLCNDVDGFRIFYKSSIKGIFSLYIENPLIKKHNSKYATLEKSAINPVIEPNNNDWESESVFNPAVYHDGKTTHMLYRAIGGDGVSRLGYASSDNGHYFNDRHPVPALQIPSPRSRNGKYDPIMYPSGGSWGGVEDPRMVEIDGIIYVTASVFDGWDFIRMAAFSISRDDLVARCFNWNDPVYLSPPSVISKNWVLFPEKINGKFAIFHGLTKGGRKKANIDYLDTLDKEGEYIESDDTFRHEIIENEWDSMIRGAGPPPLKTKYGWLLFYHAVDSRESNRYKLGAMLLDLKDPTKILYRSKQPLLEPNEIYENKGKPGVVYATGATLVNNIVNIYYGGADAVVCCASMPLDRLIEGLMTDKQSYVFNNVYLY